MTTKKTYHECCFSPDDHSPSEQDQKVEISSTTTKTFVTEEHFLLAEPTKSQALVVEEEKEKREDNDEDEHKLESEGWAVFRADGVEIQLNLKQRVERERKANDAAKEEDDDAERYLIGKSVLLGY